MFSLRWRLFRRFYLTACWRWTSRLSMGLKILSPIKSNWYFSLRSGDWRRKETGPLKVSTNYLCS